MPADSQGELPEFAASLVSPVSPDNPVGEDPKYSNEYETIKAEVTKTSDRNWETVLECSVKVLREQAKDITVLGYLLQASLLRQGWSGAAAVARAYAVLLTAHWDDIHPQRERARVNALKWLGEDRIVGGFEQVSVSGSDHEALRSLAQALTEINSLVRDRFPDSPPSIKPLVKVVEEKAKSVKPTSEPAAAPARSEVQAAVAVAAMEAPASVAVGGGAEPVDLSSATRSDLTKSIQKIALQLIASEPQSALGYKLLRINRWQDVLTAPRSDKGLTPFPAPNKVRASALEGLCTQKSWAEILSRSETAFTEPGMQFWLDLQYLAVQALEGKGHGACAVAVRAELKALLERVPMLADLKFADGTPFANPQTRAWLDELTREASGPAAVSAAVREISLEDDCAKASELAASGKVAEALELLQGGLLYGDLRQRTQRQLAIARLALLHGRLRLAAELGGQLQERSYSMRLAAWEPQMARDIAEHQLKALGAAIDAKLGDTAAWTAAREALVSAAALDNPALFSRIEF